MAGDAAAGPGVANANAQSIKVPCARQAARDMSEAIVSCKPTALFESNLAAGKINFIVGDQHRGWLNFEKIDQPGNASTGFVHKGVRDQQPDFSSLKGYQRSSAGEFFLRLKTSAQMFCKRFDKPNTSIVASVCIVAARISNPDD